MFCRKVKPDVPAYNSKYLFNLGSEINSSFTFKGNVNVISLLVISMFSLPVYVYDEIPVSYIANKKM